MWNGTIDKVLEGIGFVRLQSDHGVYVFGEGDERVFITLYVDDLPMVWKSKEALDHVKGQLQEKFDMKDLGGRSRSKERAGARESAHGARKLCSGGSSKVWDGR